MNLKLKNISTIIILIFFVLPPLKISGQGKNNILDQLSDKFLKYCNDYPWKEVYVNTDREEYIAGENIWFGLYVLDRKSNKTTGEDKIVYVEVLNWEDRPIIQGRFKIDNGFGPGQMTLPDTLSSGTYTLRAYTNWMKNFLPENAFMKKLNVYNAVRTTGFRKIADSVNVSKIDYLKSSLSPLESKFDISTNNQDPGNLYLNITTDSNFRTYNGNLCYLFIQTHGIINCKEVVNLPSDTVTINISKKMLIPGINQITIFNSIGKPVTESYIYTPVTEPGLLNIISDDSFSVRDKISMKMDFRNVQDSSLNLSNFSISVAPVSEKQSLNIADYMVFGSEFGSLPDEIRNSNLKNVPNGMLEKFLVTAKSSWIDWKKILSSKNPDIKYETEKEYHYVYGRLENKSTQVADTGRYLFLSSPGKNAIFEYAKTNSEGEFCLSIPVDDGIKDLIIQPEEVERGNRISISSSYSDKYPRSVLIKDDSFNKASDISKLSVNYQVSKIYQSDAFTPATAIHFAHDAFKRFYGKPDIELVMDDYIKLPVMQEVFFELMPGVFLKKKKANYEITISDPVANRIYERPPILFVDGVPVHEPAVIANLDPELVEKIDAVKGMYVVGDYLFYGLVNVITRAGDFSNVILPEYAVRLPYRVTEPVKSFSSPEYSSPESGPGRIPDFRNTLYWNPSVKPGKDDKAEIDFWSSDCVSDYQVIIQGLTNDGKAFSERKIIKVR